MLTEKKNLEGTRMEAVLLKRWATCLVVLPNLKEFLLQ
jgi:hypothetical protein